MTATPFDILGDAWRLWRREYRLLLAVAGPLLFLPAYATALLLPLPPTMPDRGAPPPEVLAWLTRFSDWATANGVWLLLQFAITYFGVFAMLVLLLDARHVTAGEALVIAARRVARFLLASFVVGVAATAGLLLFFLPGVYVMARAIGVGPALAADPNLSTVAAIQRSMALTRGHVLLLMGIVVMLALAGWTAEQPFAAIDHWLREAGGANPIARAIVDAAMAGVATLAALATMLVQVTAYQRLGGAANSGM